MGAARRGPTAPVGTTPARVRVLDDGTDASRDDVLVTEEPLEIRVAAAGSGSGEARTVAVTMRTPGADFELAAGYLHTEGVVGERGEIRRIDYCLDPATRTADPRFNVVTVRLTADVVPDLSALERIGTMSSACGVCGKASLEALRRRGLTPLPPDTPVVDRVVLYGLPDSLRAAQTAFAATGGLHAAGLFGATGDVRCVREDIGRHNAVDKVIGWSLLHGRGNLSECLLMVSGRAGFEIVQKAAAAGIPVVCAVSAPSSLAVAAAEEFGITLVGFLRGERANVYTGPTRVR